MEKPFSALVPGFIACIACILMAGCASEAPTPDQLEVMRPRPALLADPAQLKPGPKGSELLYYQTPTPNRRATAES